MRYDPRSDQTNIYNARFKGVLDGQILIAGRGFSFLGFSHSSLRSQSCWFMAPMFLDGSLQLPSQILRSLGEFSSIRVAAKCAARIGQSFTDTNSTVVIQEDQVFELPMVIRNGYDFGDGFGTISKELLEAVWRVYGTRRALKPTALQLRYQGYKGMVSLDPRLPGKRLMLRENMKKFEAPSANHLEICGAGFRPLPMMLNRQLIRILQDLGIPLEAFMKLQQRAVDELRVMTGNAINTSHFLEQTDSRATNVPSLIYRLWKVGLDYHQDSFLSKVVEINVITKLRDIRYRGRIPIPIDGGVTLYGIMDETCTLKENEVHVVRVSHHYAMSIGNSLTLRRSPKVDQGEADGLWFKTMFLLHAPRLCIQVCGAHALSLRQRNRC